MVAKVCTASVPGTEPMRVSSRLWLLESGLALNNGWRAGNAAWETGFGSAAAAASRGPLAPFLSLLHRALPIAAGHAEAMRMPLHEQARA